MAPLNVDHAVIGSSPLAQLLAGVLVAAHGRTVCLLTDAGSALRLPRGVDLSVAPITRPHSWSLLQATTAETVRLIGKAGARGAVARIDPVLAAETARGAAALSHVRHVTLGFGYDAERMRDDVFPAPGTTLRFRDAVYLDRLRLQPALEGWLKRIGVHLRPARGAAAQAGQGGFEIVAGAETMHATSLVLADDPAIFAHLAGEWREQLFDSVPTLTLLTEPAEKLMAPFVAMVDRDIVFTQRSTRSVSAFGLGRTDEVLARIGAHLAGYGALRRAGQGVFRSLRSRDGGPVTGQVANQGPVIIGDLGWSGIFLAPAIARWLAGEAKGMEADYFAAHAPSPGALRSGAADYLRSAEPASVLDVA